VGSIEAPRGGGLERDVPLPTGEEGIAEVLFGGDTKTDWKRSTRYWGAWFQVKLLK